ncbi:hypothetical protein [Oricola sp.]|uniref:hypothetical protein n=1 Tax=Oricola sp. TaxID=1979950 RepID=UPI003BAC55F6
MTAIADGIHVLSEVVLDLSDAPLDFGEDRRAAIEAFWAERLARSPRLWNGPMYLFRETAIEGGVLRATAHRTDFATFLFWRSDPSSDPSICHITGTSMPVTADEALFAVRMAAHTATAGAVYFPAGSLEAGDVSAGRFDVTRSIARELGEETGIALSAGRLDDCFLASHVGGSFHVARRCRLPFSFSECAARLAEHQAATGDDEVEGAVRIGGDDDSRALLRPYARQLADWHFDGVGTA